MLFKNDKLGKLLLSVDGSEFSEGAVREAIALAKAYSGNLTGVYVLETNPEYEAMAPGLVEKSAIEAKSFMDALKSRAATEGVQCETVVRRDDQPFKAITDEAQKRQADIVIMGRRGRTGISRLLMGSVTAKVIGHAHCDVLVVPRAAKIKLRNILVATDGSKFGDKACAVAMGIAGKTGGRMTVVSVMQFDTLQPIENVDLRMKEKLEKETVESELKKAEACIKAVKEKAAGSNIDTEGFVYTGMPYEAIIEAAKARNADLIVVGSHGRTGISRLLMGSVAERVIGLADCAVYVAKAG